MTGRDLLVILFQHPHHYRICYVIAIPDLFVIAGPDLFVIAGPDLFVIAGPDRQSNLKC